MGGDCDDIRYWGHARSPVLGGLGSRPSQEEESNTNSGEGAGAGARARAASPSVSKSRPSRASVAKSLQSLSVTPRQAILKASLYIFLSRYWYMGAD
ncbi:hypothetical protein EYF80_041540 [Liparis tanakae]|uniref:Uncharacterized protein n=1 Tax=Liparis tanakae TaxID=230148 RepID=A0A4Z2G562_9TELE|nr:hypothetical protein EYF80_041540 [Liparis tanakae]